jgi:hypothetical protein
MFLTGCRKASLGVLFAGAMLTSCGGRSGIPEGDGTGPLVPCNSESDCFDGNLCRTRSCQEGYCKTVATELCDDANVCTIDTCEPSTGACVFQPRVADDDEDGFVAALPGTVPGAAGSCGNDCNDSNPRIYPNAPEVCDGADNNCNGVIDEGVNAYSPVTSPIQISDDSFTVGSADDIVYDGDRFGISWTGQQGDGNYQGYISGYDILGFSKLPTKNISQTSNNSYGGPLIWTGSAYATAWEVRGEKGYDIVFNQLDVNGKKLGPDVHITDNRGFSIQPTLLWNGVHYWIVWSDNNGGRFQIYGRRVESSGQVSEPSALTNGIDDARAPRIVASPTSILLVYLSGGRQRLLGQVLNADLTPEGPSFYISDEGAYDYSVAWVNDRFVVAFSTEQADVGDAIWAATFDPNGKLLASAQRITDGANFARSPSVLSLGDRFALAWSDDRLEYTHYGIRLRTYDTNLNPLAPVTSLVETSSDSLYPSLAAGGSGMALAFRSRVNDTPGQPYFLPLACSGAFGF